MFLTLSFRVVLIVATPCYHEYGTKKEAGARYVGPARLIFLRVVLIVMIVTTPCYHEYGTRWNHEASWRKVCGATVGVSLDCK